MRKIEQQMNSALLRRANWTNSNTSVQYNELTNCSQVLLHGHQIATLDHHSNALKLSSCGWQTVTTKSRLNAILSEFKYGCKVFQKNFFNFGQGRSPFKKALLPWSPPFDRWIFIFGSLTARPQNDAASCAPTSNTIPVVWCYLWDKGRSGQSSEEEAATRTSKNGIFAKIGPFWPSFRALRFAGVKVWS